MNRRRALTTGAALLLLQLALLPVAPAAARFWPLKRESVPAAPAPLPAHAAAGLAPAPPAAPVRLQVHDRGSHYDVEVSNPLPGPVQVRLALTGGEGLRPAPRLPTEAVLPAHAARILARLYRDGAQAVDGFTLDLVQVPGDPRARALDAPYRLPFEGAPVRLDQGFGGHYSHADPANYYAVDFALPEGTPVLAARDGVVLEIVAGDPRTGHAVRILHDDGSMAVYAHLQAGSAAVRIGERARQGQRIARSGNTGFSTAPHLHFAVQANAGMQLRSIPFRMFADAGELKFARDETTAQGASVPSR